MANKHYKVDEEFEITLKVKVKVGSISNYFPMDDNEIKEEIEEFKNSIGKHLEDKLKNDYSEEVCNSDFISYEVK